MSDLSFGAADGEVPPAGPGWLRLGARHHFTGQTWKPAGLQACSTTKRYFEETWISSDVPLSDIATPEGYREVNAAWQLALLGVDLLAELAGPEAVVAYFVALKSGTTWEQEFSKAFGMTVDEFYELFEERRAAGFPRPSCSLADFPSLSATIQHRPWFEDDLSEAEDSAVEWLLKLAIYGEEETAVRLIGMPFLESVESDDILVLRGITYLVSRSQHMELATIINHPTLRDGITGGLATLVVAATTLRDADEIERMLNPGYADIETLSKGTALTPHLKISIVRTGTPRQPDTASGLWNGLEFSERMLQTPLPVSHAIFVMNHNAVPEGHGGGNHKGFAIAYNPGFEQGGHQAGRQLHFVHETSHYFWIHGENWISEGMAETAAWMYAAESGAGPGLWKLPRYDCEAHDLEMLMEWNPRGYRAEQRICYYYLGQQLFLELQENLEPGEFSEKLRELYLLTRDREAAGETSGIDEVRQVFHEQSQTVEKHWSGKLNAPENRSYHEYRYSRYTHDLIQWDQYPTYDGQHVNLRGTLLRDAVLASGTLTEAEGGYPNFELISDDGQFIGNIQPPSSSAGSEYETVEYSLEGRTFTVKFAFPNTLGDPQEHLVNVMGFLDESRMSSLFGSEVQTLGYARIRVKQRRQHDALLQNAHGD